jgi:hypothetical protein
MCASGLMQGTETSYHGDGAEGRLGLMAVGVAGVSGGIGLFGVWRRMALKCGVMR